MNYKISDVFSKIEVFIFNNFNGCQVSSEFINETHSPLDLFIPKFLADPGPS